jgi:RNA exonuclease 1
MVRAPPAGSQRQKADQRSTLGPGYGEFRTDYEPILARIARAQAHARPGGAGGGARAAIVDNGNLGAWPATTVSCTSDAEMIEGVVGALDPHEFVFARLMTLADALGCTWACALFSLLSVPLSIRS